MKVVETKRGDKSWLVNKKGKRITKKYDIMNADEWGPFFMVYAHKRTDYCIERIRMMYDVRTEMFIRNIEAWDILTKEIIALKYSNKWHLYNKKGELLRSDVEHYYTCKDVHLIKVQIDSKKYFMTEEAKIISDGFEYLGDFNSSLGYCVVRPDESKKYGIIDINMNYILNPIECYSLYPLTQKYVLVTKNGKEGIVDISGNQIIPCIYDKIRFESGYFIVKYNNHYGLIDSTGKIVFDTIYPEIIETPDKFVVHDFNKLETSKDLEVNK